MIKNIFLDRDGVINEIVMRDTIIGSPRSMQEFKIREEFKIFCSLIRQYSCNLFVVSNQPDVSRGLLNSSVLIEMNQKIEEMIPMKEILYCIHDDADNCSCRKPKPGMINTLLNKYSLKREESCIIGDGIKDMEAGRAAGITTIFLETDYNKIMNVNADYKIISLQNFFQLELVTFAA